MASALANLAKHSLGKALRETGTAMERTSKAFVGDLSFWDHVSRHTTAVPVDAQSPCVAESACVAPSATLVGGAAVGAKATVGVGAVVYGPAAVGDGAVVGHGAVVKADVFGAVADNAVVLEAVPEGELWGGAPAAFLKKLE